MVCKWKLLAAACIALSGLPANADESKPWVLPHASNWHGYHGGYAQPFPEPGAKMSTKTSLPAPGAKKRSRDRAREPPDRTADPRRKGALTAHTVVLGEPR